MAKAKNLIRMISQEGTGTFFVTKKNPKGIGAQKKIELRKFDKKLRKHVIFREAKIK